MPVPISGTSRCESAGNGPKLAGHAVVVLVSIVILVFIYRWKRAAEAPPVHAPFDPRQTARVQVLNGCGIGGAAGRVRDYLMRYRVDVRETGNAAHRYPASVVLDRSGSPEKAAKVAELLGVPPSHVIQQINANLIDIDVTVIVGRDFPDLNGRLR